MSLCCKHKSVPGIKLYIDKWFLCVCVFVFFNITFGLLGQEQITLNYFNKDFLPFLKHVFFECQWNIRKKSTSMLKSRKLLKKCISNNLFFIHIQNRQRYEMISVQSNGNNLVIHKGNVYRSKTHYWMYFEEKRSESIYLFLPRCIEMESELNQEGYQ